MLVYTINNKSIRLIFALVFLLTVMLSCQSNMTQLSGSPITIVFVHPPTNIVEVGQTFFIEIRISDVIDLYGWEFKLEWNPNLLDVFDVTEGPFLNQSGETFFTKRINNTEGSILVDCTLLGDIPGVNGSGILAYVEFHAENEGSCILDLHSTKLVNSLELLIPHTTNDGNVTSSKPVGGIIVPADKIELLTPWIQAASTIVFAVIAIAVLLKRTRKEK